MRIKIDETYHVASSCGPKYVHEVFGENSLLRLSFIVKWQYKQYKSLKLKLRVFLASHSVAMVTYCVTKIIPTCSLMIGHCFDTMIKNGYNDPSKSWNVLKTVLSHLNI